MSDIVNFYNTYSASSRKLTYNSGTLTYTRTTGRNTTTKKMSISSINIDGNYFVKLSCLKDILSKWGLEIIGSDTKSHVFNPKDYQGYMGYNAANNYIYNFMKTHSTKDQYGSSYSPFSQFLKSNYDMAQKVITNFNNFVNARDVFTGYKQTLSDHGLSLGDFLLGVKMGMNSVLFQFLNTIIPKSIKETNSTADAAINALAEYDVLFNQGYQFYIESDYVASQFTTSFKTYGNKQPDIFIQLFAKDYSKTYTNRINEILAMNSTGSTSRVSVSAKVDTVAAAIKRNIINNVNNTEENEKYITGEYSYEVELRKQITSRGIDL